MSKRFLLLCVAFALLCGIQPALAQDQGGFSAGVVVWTHSADLAVDSATDFDGSDDTFATAARDWDLHSSRFGVRVNYEFEGMFSLYGELGQASATVRDEDVTDPNLDLESRGFNDDMYLALGTRVGNERNGEGRFWSAGLRYSSLSTDVSPDVDTNFDYDETILTLDGRMGTHVGSVGIYGGLRYAQYTADMDETDLTQLAGQTLRTVELNRDDDFDLLVGIRSNTEKVNGFVQLGFIGSFTANAGMTFRF